MKGRYEAAKILFDRKILRILWAKHVSYDKQTVEISEKRRLGNFATHRIYQREDGQTNVSNNLFQRTYFLFLSFLITVLPTVGRTVIRNDKKRKLMSATNDWKLWTIMRE